MSKPEAFFCGLVVLVAIVGCGGGQSPPAETKAVVAEKKAVEAETEAVEAETEAVEAETPVMAAVVEDEKPLDAEWVLERLKESCASLPPDSTTEWAIAHSSVTWSTCTVHFGLPFPDDGAATVWEKWTKPISALTIKANRQIKAEIDATVSEAIREGSRVEREFDFKGFEIFINASAVPHDGMSFVRISFKAQ